MIHDVIKYPCLFLVCLTLKDGSIQYLEMSTTTHPMICNIPEDLNSYQRLLSITHNISKSLCLSPIVINTRVSLCSQYVTATPNKFVYIVSYQLHTQCAAHIGILNIFVDILQYIFSFPSTYHICCAQTVQIFTLYQSLSVCLLLLPLLRLQICRNFLTLSRVLMSRPSLPSLFFIINNILR